MFFIIFYFIPFSFSIFTSKFNLLLLFYYYSPYILSSTFYSVYDIFFMYIQRSINIHPIYKNINITIFPENSLYFKDVPRSYASTSTKLKNKNMYTAIITYIVT